MTDGEDRDGTTRRRRVKPENSKRASGESSIYRDEDGRWHGFVSMGKKENGRRDRRHVSGAKRADVVAKVRAIEAKRDAGMVDAAGRAPTVGEWLDHWLDNIAARKVRARTLESYRSTVRLHLRPGIGHHRLDRLQPEHLERLYAVLADKGLSPASILRAHRVLSRALRVASQRGKVARNVATLVDPPAVRRPQTALPLSAQEARQVMAAAQTRRNAARWTVALASGLRQSKALALQWSDVDLGKDTPQRPARPAPRQRSRTGLRGAQGRPQPPHPGAPGPTRRGAARPPGRPARGAHCSRPAVGGPRPGLRPAQRPADRAQVGLARLEDPSEGGGRAGDPAARRPAHRGDAPAGRGRAPAGRHGGARPRTDANDHGHLQPCAAGPRPGCGGPDGTSAVGLSWHRIGSSGHHGGTRNDSGRFPEGRTAWSEGWS
jgi:hypothetical protein